MSPGSSEQLLEEQVARIVTAMDDLLVVANISPEQIERQAIGVSQIAMRAQLILSFLEARKAPQLKVITNGRAS